MPENLSSFDYANIFTQYTDENNQQFFNLLQNFYIEGEIDPSLYNSYYFTEHDDWYTLAYKFYNDYRLWWVILIANNIINPFELPNNPIKILKSNVVSEIISKIKIK